MTIHTFTYNPFQTNGYICHDQGEAVVVDPSCHTPAECEAVQRYLKEHDLTVRHLLLTHGHIDHIFGCQFFVDRYEQSFQMHRADLPFLQHAPDQATMFGLRMDPVPVPTRFLHEGDILSFGNTTWTVREAPGHSPGSVLFHDEARGYVIAGDVLFQGSIGRTDLPMGDLPTLMRSIHDQLLTLDDDVAVYPGHGPHTTIGRERRYNPFLNDER
ncbi:MAG: MBL fold metallo-hydrolase [Bacteroidota bacterium]